MSIEETLRSVVREEVEAVVRPLREQLARLTLNAPAVSDLDELGLSAAAEVSGYAVPTLRRAIRSSELAAVKGLKEWRVRRGDLRAWMHRNHDAGTLRPLDISAKAEKMLARVGGRR